MKHRSKFHRGLLLTTANVIIWAVAYVVIHDLGKVIVMFVLAEASGIIAVSMGSSDRTSDRR